MSFRCDECDGEIDRCEEFIQFDGMNYCTSCFDEHRHDLCEEGVTLTCEWCGEEITEGEYYRFDDEIICFFCAKNEMHYTTEEEIWIGVKEDEDI